jgi:hypothetical protein
MNGRKLLAGAAVLAVAGVSVSSAVRDETPAPAPIVDYGPVRLVAFDSCDNAVTELRGAMAPYVSAYGLGRGNVLYAEGMATDTGGVAKSVPQANNATPPAQQQDHSTTNVHEEDGRKTRLLDRRREAAPHRRREQGRHRRRRPRRAPGESAAGLRRPRTGRHREPRADHGEDAAP